MWLNFFLKKVRLIETLLMTGFVFIAMPFIGIVINNQFLKRAVVLFCANFLLLLSVYATNSYFGFNADKINPRLNKRQFEVPWKYFVVALVSLVFSLLLLRNLNDVLPLVAASSFLLWALYSCPGGAKERPIWGTIVHFFGQILQFHLCVLAFSSPTPSTLLVSVFFGLLFASGHIMHEVKDFEYDSLAGMRTGAVAFGRQRVMVFYKIAVILIPLYWISLLLLHVVSLKLFAPFFLASVLHALISWRRFTWLKMGSERFQYTYRLLYLLAGVFCFFLASA
jgi:4-hydroxybenzoate polyprenyltransferase